MEMFIGFNLFLIFMIIGAFVLWIWALIDIITSRFNEDLMQVVWLLVVFFLPFVGVIIYLLVGRSMKRALRPDDQVPNHRYDQLGKLKALLDEGVITQEEFQSEKEKILNH